MYPKRICTAILIAAVTAGGLTGCGGNGAERKNNLQPDNTQGGTERTTETESNADAENSAGTEISADTEGGFGTESEAGSTQKPEALYPEIIFDGQIQDFGSVVVVKNAAYELYTYVDDIADNYALSVNTAADKLSGKADVYNLLIPLGSGIVFPDNLRGKIKSSDQRKAMSEIQAKMDSSVRLVDIYDSLMEHRDEYIYFRTDHHWTALGAYYAYEDFCEVKGMDAEALDSYETVDFDGFLGSFYKDTNGEASLKESPDVVTAYIPNMDAVCHITDSRGVQYDSNVIYDESKSAPGLKYSAFIAGDNPYTVIENKELDDGSACVVVKESFGNSFVPFLVDHYQTIYVVDYRYWTGSVTKLAVEKGAQDVIFINNLSMMRNKNLVGKLYRVI